MLREQNTGKMGKERVTLHKRVQPSMSTYEYGWYIAEPSGVKVKVRGTNGLQKRITCSKNSSDDIGRHHVV